jgi:hypothetical protein
VHRRERWLYPHSPSCTLRHNTHCSFLQGGRSAQYVVYICPYIPTCTLTRRRGAMSTPAPYVHCMYSYREEGEGQQQGSPYSRVRLCSCTAALTENCPMAVMYASIMLRATPPPPQTRQRCLSMYSCTPDSQWQPRGKSRILQGCQRWTVIRLTSCPAGGCWSPYSRPGWWSESSSVPAAGTNQIKHPKSPYSAWCRSR